MLPCRYDAGSFFANWAAVLLSLLTAQSIGLLVGSVVTHPKTGQTIATITALSMVLVRQRNHLALSAADIYIAVGQRQRCLCIVSASLKNISIARCCCPVRV